MGPLASAEFPNSSGEEKETPNTPKVVLTYQPNDAHMFYISAAKGFRVGGANAPVPLKSATNPQGCDLPAQPPPYSADSLWSYDIGAKDLFLNGRLRINSSAYVVKWKNIQQQIILATSCGFGYIANTGDATSRGFDLDIEAAVTPAVLLGLSASYIHATVNGNANAPDGTIIYEKGDAIGSPPAPISPWNLTGSVRYSFDAFGGRRAYVRVEDIFRSRNPGPFNTQIPAAVSYDLTIPANPSTNLLNARLGLDISPVELVVFLNNALNSHPLLNRYHDTAASGLYTDTTLRPRTFGISGTYKF
jgi:outer membrane receptor protein involved in Fe transport